MNKFRQANIHETYVKKIKPTFSHQIGEDFVDFTKILESIQFHIKRTLKIKQDVKLTMETLSESHLNSFHVESSEIWPVHPYPFSSIILESVEAEWNPTAKKMYVEMNWKYVEKSGKVIKGDQLCRLELDAAGTILKHV